MTAPPSRQRVITRPFAFAWLAYFVYFAAGSALWPVLALFVEGELGGTNSDVGVAVGVFAVTAILARPFVGRFGDKSGRRPLVLMGSLLVVVTTAAYVFVEVLMVLIVLRLIQGVAEAMYFTGANASVADMAPDERRGEALSLFSVALYAGFSIGPLLGEAVFKAFGFDVLWLASAALSLFAFFFSLGVPESKPLDIEPIRGALINRKGLLPGIVIAASVWGFTGFFAFVPLYARELGMSGSRFVFATYSVTVLTIRLLGARIPDRYGARRTTSVCMAISVIGLWLIAGIHAPWALYAGAAILGIGQSLSFPALFSLAIESASPGERVSVISTFTAFLDIAFGLGPFTLGIVADLTSYNGTFFASSLVTAAGLGLLLVRAHQQRPARSQAA